MSISYHLKTVKVPQLYMILSEYKLMQGWPVGYFFSVWFCNLFITLVEYYFSTKGLSGKQSNSIARQL